MAKASKKQTVTIIIRGEEAAARMMRRHINYERHWFKSDYDINLRIIVRGNHGNKQR